MDTVYLHPSSVCVATIAGLDAAGALLVRLTGSDEAVQSAFVLWSAVQIDWSRCVGLRCAVAPLGADQNALLLLGLLEAPPPSALLNSTVTLAARIEACESLVLQCGKARIALAADGKIEILAGEIVSRSKGAHRIQGGSVQIN